ncbi:MAG: hypothetical protein NZ772_04595, partial [Cyanobacteria bacterium]|nr:hypothetical protein [Cyanobacteriota bacterium]MDW8200669.1 hypothetical protein [Cyanobacteriota bacterium SKYGB_h_bin112]
MPSQYRSFLSSFKSKLSRQVILWVFISLVAIETIILIPSAFNRQQELLRQLEEVCIASTTALIPLVKQATSDQAVLELVQTFKPQINTQLLGGALYKRNGQLVGTFGEPPVVSPNMLEKLKLIGGWHRWESQLQNQWTRLDIGIAYQPEVWDYIL